MSDTQALLVEASEDTPRLLKFTGAAVDRAKRRFNARNYDEVAAALGLSRRHFYRLLAGTHDIRLSRAVAIADSLDWPVARVFEQVDRG
jgi:predicted DNA-binding transcriptional regulator AlpA